MTQSEINKRVIPQQNMTFDYTTPDLKVVAQPVSPSLSLNFQSDLQYLQQVQQSIRMQQVYRQKTYQAIGTTMESVANAIATWEAKRKKEDIEHLQAIGPYAIAFRMEDFQKFKTKKGKELYTQMVASHYFEQFQPELIAKLQTEWSTLSKEELEKKVDEFFKEKIEQASSAIPNEIKKMWTSQANLVVQYLKSQIQTAKFQLDVQKYKEQTAQNVQTAYYKALPYLTQELEEFGQMFYEEIVPYLEKGYDLDYKRDDGEILSDFLKKQIDVLYTKVDGIVDSISTSYRLPDDVKDQLKRQLYKVVSDYLGNKFTEAHARMENFDKLKAQVEQTERMQGIVHELYLKHNLSQYEQLAKETANAYYSGEMDDDIYQVNVHTLAEAIHDKYELFVEDLKANPEFKELPANQIRAIAAKAILDKVGNIAVEEGLPELLDFVDIPDKSGISLAEGQGDDFKKAVQVLKQQAEAVRDQKFKAAEEFQKEFEKQMANLEEDNLYRGIVSLSTLTDHRQLENYPELLEMYYEMTHDEDLDINKLKQFLPEEQLRVMEPQAAMIELYKSLPAEKQVRIYQAVKAKLQANLNKNILDSPYLTPEKKDWLLRKLADMTTGVYASKSDPDVLFALYSKAFKGLLRWEDLTFFKDSLSKSDIDKLITKVGATISDKEKDAAEIVDSFTKIYNQALSDLEQATGLDVTGKKFALTTAGINYLKYVSEQIQKDPNYIPTPKEFNEFLQKHGLESIDTFMGDVYKQLSVKWAQPSKEIPPQIYTQITTFLENSESFRKTLPEHPLSQFVNLFDSRLIITNDKEDQRNNIRQKLIQTLPVFLKAFTHPPTNIKNIDDYVTETMNMWITKSLSKIEGNLKSLISNWQTAHPTYAEIRNTFQQLKDYFSILVKTSLVREKVLNQIDNDFTLTLDQSRLVSLVGQACEELGWDEGKQYIYNIVSSFDDYMYLKAKEEQEEFLDLTGLGTNY